MQATLLVETERESPARLGPVVRRIPVDGGMGLMYAQGKDKKGFFVYRRCLASWDAPRGCGKRQELLSQAAFRGNAPG